MSSFRGDPRIHRRDAVRRRMESDPEWKGRQEAWDERIELIMKAKEPMSAAGFDRADHYHPGGVPSYCKCGTVSEHNAHFDEILRRYDDE